MNPDGGAKLPPPSAWRGASPPPSSPSGAEGRV